MLGQVTDPAAQRNGRAGPRRVAILTHTGRPAAVSAANRLVEGLHRAGIVSAFPPDDLSAIDPRLSRRRHLGGQAAHGRGRHRADDRARR